jgi:hypothetical protein
MIVDGAVEVYRWNNVTRKQSLVACWISQKTERGGELQERKEKSFSFFPKKIFERWVAMYLYISRLRSGYVEGVVVVLLAAFSLGTYSRTGKAVRKWHGWGKASLHQT